MMRFNFLINLIFIGMVLVLVGFVVAQEEDDWEFGVEYDLDSGPKKIGSGKEFSKTGSGSTVTVEDLDIFKVNNAKVDTGTGTAGVLVNVEGEARLVFKDKPTNYDRYIKITGDEGTKSVETRESLLDVKLTNERLSFEYKDDGRIVLDNVDSLDLNIEAKEDSVYEMGGLKFKVEKGDSVSFEGGLITKGDFIVEEDGRFPLGLDEINLERGTEVSFDGNKVEIKLPKKKDLGEEELKKITNGKITNDYFFSSKDKMGLKFDGKVISVEGVGYEGRIDGKGIYVRDTQLVVGSGKLLNSEGSKIFMDDKGEVNKMRGVNYFSYNDREQRLVVGANGVMEGPIYVAPNNHPWIHPTLPPEILVRSNRHLAIQPLGNVEWSYVAVDGRYKTGKTPEMEVLNEAYVDNDNIGIKYTKDREEVYLNPRGGFVEGVDSSNTNTVAMTVKHYKTASQEDVAFYEKLGSAETQRLLGKDSIEVRDIIPIDKFAQEDKSGNRVIRDLKMGISSRGEVAYGINTRFMKSGNYAHLGNSRYTGSPTYDYFYTGISDLEIYNFWLTEKGFEALTGIELVANDGFSNNYLHGSGSQERIRHLMDFYFSLPEGYKLPPKITLYEDRFPRSLKTAQTWNDGRVEISIGTNTQNGFLNIDVLSHELGHTAHFLDKELPRWYNNYGISRYTKTSDYAGEDQYEHFSEFISNYAYDDNSEYNVNIVRAVKGDYGENKASAYRAATAIMWYKNVWRPERVAQIFEGAGVGYSPTELKNYIRAWGIDVK
jgi:hypothetical protein